MLFIYDILIKGDTSIFLLATDTVKPEWSETREVELYKDHVYCLVPSIATDNGFARLYSEMPVFIKELPSHVFLGKVLHVNK